MPRQISVPLFGSGSHIAGKRLALALALLLSVVVVSRGQTVPSPYCIALRSNLVYDAALVPNIGVEVPVYKGLSFSGDWNFAWWKIPARNVFYQTYGGYAGLRYHFGSLAQEHPLLGHFVGVSGIGLSYDFEFGGRGFQCDGWNFGVQAEYGYTLPLKDGKWAFAFSAGIGYLRLKYNEYLPEDTHFVWQDGAARNWFGPTRLEVSIFRVIEFNGRDGGRPDSRGGRR